MGVLNPVVSRRNDMEHVTFFFFKLILLCHEVNSETFVPIDLLSYSLPRLYQCIPSVVFGNFKTFPNPFFFYLNANVAHCEM